MTIWSTEINELETLYPSIKGRFPELEKELERLIKADDENMVLLYSRRCLEVIITDLCESELKRSRKTEPLKGIIDKLNREEKVPLNIIVSMQHLNSLSTFGAHPKDFDPEQVKPVLNNLTTIIKWYLKYSNNQAISKPREGELKDEIKPPDDSAKQIHKPKKRLILLLYGLALVVVIIVVILYLFNIIGDRKQVEDLTKLEKSIAVLPFENMSAEEEYLYIGDAITDEIILELQKINEFDRVLSRTSTMQYKFNRPTIPEIAEKLGVNYLIEGTIQRYKEDVSVRVQVIRAKHEDHVWGEEYNGRWEDIFSIQDEIALKVANELKTVLSPEERERIDRQPTNNPEAYDLYLKGRWFWNKWTDTDIRKGMEYFEQAIELDPDFALAYAGLAEAYNTLSFYGQLHPEETYPKAKDLAMKALEIDNTLADAYIALAFIKVYYDWDWEGGEQEFKKAIALDPDNVTAHHLYAYFLVLQARYNEALVEINKALSLDPLNLITNRTLGDFYYHRREYDKAEEQLIKTLEMDSAFNYTHAYLGLVYLQKSLCQKALKELQCEISFGQGTEDIALTWKGCAYGICGYRKEACEILNNLQERSENKHIPPTYFTWIYFALGENENGFEWLDKAFNERDPWLTEIKSNHFYDGIHTDPRYIELLKKMKLEK